MVEQNVPPCGEESCRDDRPSDAVKGIMVALGAEAVVVVAILALILCGVH